MALASTSEAAGQVSGAPLEDAEPAPIFLLTMGPDQSLIFRKWGHGALCVGDQCLNYGVTDFSRPVGLVQEVMRGEAVFWVAVSAYEDMVRVYSRDDRSVFRQDLDLSPEARDALLGRISQDLVPGQSEYIYNHFDDNCTSRIRDYLDEAASGKLREPIPLPLPFEIPEREPTFRGHIRRGLHEDPFLLWLSDVGIGSVADEPISSFDAMFLPGALRYGVEQAFDAPPRRLHSGSYGDLLPPDPGSRPYLPWLLGFRGAPRSAHPAAGSVRTPADRSRGCRGLDECRGSGGDDGARGEPLPEFRTSLIAARGTAHRFTPRDPARPLVRTGADSPGSGVFGGNSRGGSPPAARMDRSRNPAAGGCHRLAPAAIFGGLTAGGQGHAAQLL